MSCVSCDLTRAHRELFRLDRLSRYLCRHYKDLGLRVVYQLSPDRQVVRYEAMYLFVGRSGASATAWLEHRRNAVQTTNELQTRTKWENRAQGLLDGSYRFPGHDSAPHQSV